MIEINGCSEREKECRVAGRKRPRILGEQLVDWKVQKRSRAVIEKTNYFGNSETRNKSGNKV